MLIDESERTLEAMLHKVSFEVVGPYTSPVNVSAGADRRGCGRDSRTVSVCVGCSTGVTFGAGADLKATAPREERRVPVDSQSARHL